MPMTAAWTVTASCLPQLVPELYQFIYLEENDLSKNDSIRLSALTPQEQGILLQALRELQQKKQALGEKYDQFFRMLRRDALQQAELPEGPERLQGVKDAAEKAETAVVLQCRPKPDQKPAKPALVDSARGQSYVAALDKAEKTLRKLGKSKKDLAAMRIYEQNRAWAETSLREQLLTIQNLTAQLLKDLEEG